MLLINIDFRSSNLIKLYCFNCIFSKYVVILLANNPDVLSFQSSHLLFFILFCPIALARAFSTVLNRSNNNEHFCFVADFEIMLLKLNLYLLLGCCWSDSAIRCQMKDIFFYAELGYFKESHEWVLNFTKCLTCFF